MHCHAAGDITRNQQIDQATEHMIKTTVNTQLRLSAFGTK